MRKDIPAFRQTVFYDGGASSLLRAPTRTGIWANEDAV